MVKLVPTHFFVCNPARPLHGPYPQYGWDFPEARTPHLILPSTLDNPSWMLLSCVDLGILLHINVS